MENTSVERHAWLETGILEFRPLFDKIGYPLSDNIRASIGFTQGGGGRRKAIGQMWSPKVVTDGVPEMFISPEVNDGRVVLGVTGHELCHNAVGVECGHRGPFRKCALAIGLTGKMTATANGPAMEAFAADFIKRHGPYPAGRIDYSARKRQTTRMIKCECRDCKYVARTTRKFLVQAGAPLCPCNGKAMASEYIKTV